MAFDRQGVAITFRAEGGDQVRREVDGIESGLERLGAGVKSAALVGAGLFALIPAVQQLASQTIQAADAVTTLRNQLRLATGSAEAARAAYDDLFRIAQASRVSFTELGGTFATISRAGQELGISQRRLLTVTEAIGNAMTVSGGSAASMQAALVQLSQGLGSGTLRGEELNSVMEQTPRLAKALADGLGVPIGQLRKLGEEGKITSEQVIAALESQATRLAQEVSGATMTVSQGMTVLTNTMTQFIGQADEASGATSALAGFLVAVSDGIQWIAKNTPLLDVLKTAAQTIRLLWSDVRFVFQGVGREIGGIAAQAAAVLAGDFSGAVAIRRAMIEDAKAARAALDTYQRGVVAPAAPVTFEQSEAETDRLLRRSTQLRKAQADAAEAEAKRLKAAAKAAEDAAKAEAKAWDEAVKEYLQYREQVARAQAKVFDDQVAAVTELQRQIDAQRDANLSALEGADALKTLEIARLREIASMAARKAFVLFEREGNAGLAEQYLRQAEALRTLADEREKGMGIEAAKRDQQAIRRTSEEAKKAAETMQNQITEALMRAFEAGKGFAQSFKDTVVNMFQTMVLRPVVQAIVQPVMGFMGQGGGATGGSMLSSFASSSMGQMLGMPALGSLSGLGGIFSSGAQMAINGGGSTALQGAGSMISNGSIGQGLAQGAGVAGAYLGGATLGVYGGRAISGGRSAFGGTGNAAVNVGTVAGAILGGPIGAAIGGAIGGAINRAFGQGPREVKERGIVGDFGDGGFGGQSFESWARKGGWFSSGSSGTDYKGLDATTQDALNAGGRAMLASAQSYAKALGLPVEQLARVTSSARITLTGNAEADTKAITAALEQYGEALAGFHAGYIRPLAKEGEKLMDTLQRLAGLQTFSTAINQLGGVFSRVANLSFDAREGLLALAGGMEAFTGKAMAFVQDYYNRDEIAGLKASEIQTALRGLGIDQTITSREDFRRLVDGTDVSSEAGRAQLNALLDLAPAFKDVADYLAENSLTLSQAAAMAPAGSPLAAAFPQDATVNAIQTSGSMIVRGLETIADLIRSQGGPLVNWRGRPPMDAAPEVNGGIIDLRPGAESAGS